MLISGDSVSIMFEASSEESDHSLGFESADEIFETCRERQSRDRNAAPGAKTDCDAPRSKTLLPWPSSSTHATRPVVQTHSGSTFSTARVGSLGDRGPHHRHSRGVGVEVVLVWRIRELLK